MKQIVTRFECPPIPDRSFDYSAAFDGYDLGDPIGTGPNPREAVVNLLDQLDEVPEYEIVEK